MEKKEKEYNENPQKYLYDAFISYRHVPLDKAVAERLQELLENFRFSNNGKKASKSPLMSRKHPGRLRIFRDQSELLTSNDLGAKIREALLQSRYLIVICSEYTKESVWCMEEIRLFKEAHQESTRHILTLIVSGEPDNVLPEPLRWEKRPISLPTGQTILRKETLEPLSADIRAQTHRQSLRKLKVEFLRIAAPILNCGFDELFQRHQRRRRRNAIILFTGTLTLLAVILLVISVFAYRTWVSENNYRNILVDNYTKEGNRYANSGKPQEALLYYTEALSLNSDKTSAASGAALLLQEYLWPVLEKEMVGCIRNNTFLPSPSSMAGSLEKGYYLHLSLGQSTVVDENGNLLAELGTDYLNFLGSSAGWWSFSGENELRFYQPETKEMRHLPYPDEVSAGCTTDSLYNDEPHALFFAEDKIIVAYNGIVHIYSFDGQGRAGETAQADLAEAFPVDAKQNGISRQNNICLSADGSLALISSYDLVALYDTQDLNLKAAVSRYLDGLTGMDISPNGEYFVLSYGNPYRINLLNPGGCFEVYSRNGELLFASPKSEKEAWLGTVFDPTNSERLLVWGADSVHVWNWKEGKEIMAPVRENDIRSACFTDEGALLTDRKNQTVSVYTLAEFLPRAAVLRQNEGKLPSIRQYYMDVEGPDGMTLSLNASTLTLNDAKGKALDTATLPAMGQRVALSQNFQTAYLYHLNYPALMRVPVDFKAGKLGKVRQLDTGNEATLGIWFKEGWLAAETASRNLLLFNENDKQICKIMPEHNGNIVSLLMDSDMRYIACIMESVTSNSHDYHFDKTGIVEIWDTSSQLLLTSFEKAGQEINAAIITDNGAFTWSVNDETYTRQLSMPIPDEETIRFLQGLCCLALDAKQDFMLKKPLHSDLRMGSWSVLVQEGKPLKDNSATGKAGTTEQTLTELVNELYHAKNYGSAEWFSQCDTLWQRLRKKELPYTALELDHFYQIYSNSVAYTDPTDQIAFGLESYIALTQELLQENIASGENELITSDFHTKLLETLAVTQEYDETIAQAFHDIAALNAESEITTPSDTDATLAKINAEAIAYSTKYLEAWAESLRGNGLQAMFSLAKYCTDNNRLLSLQEAEPSALASLYTGDSQLAADSINNWITDCVQLFSANDISSIEEYMENYLLGSELLVWRGEIDASAFDEYLRKINADFGIEALETTTEAQHAGILPGDLIIEVNGQRIAGVQHYLRLRNQEETQSFKILRDGETITLTLPGPAAFTGRMTVRLRKSE